MSSSFDRQRKADMDDVAAMFERMVCIMQGMQMELDEMRERLKVVEAVAEIHREVLH